MYKFFHVFRIFLITVFIFFRKNTLHKSNLTSVIHTTPEERRKRVFGHEILSDPCPFALLRVVLVLKHIHHYIGFDVLSGLLFFELIEVGKNCERWCTFIENLFKYKNDYLFIRIYFFFRIRIQKNSFNFLEYEYKNDYFKNDYLFIRIQKCLTFTYSITIFSHLNQFKKTTI